MKRFFVWYMICYDRVDGVLSLETQNNIIVIQPGLSGHAQLKQTGNQTFNQNYIFASVQFSSYSKCILPY